MSAVKLVWSTPDAEALIAKMARVSNPDNENNPEFVGLIKYLIKHKHYSPFEMANFCVKISTSRRIAPQILRHRSFTFQERSTRYIDVKGFVDVNPRRQDVTNRQSSHDDLPQETRDWFKEMKKIVEYKAFDVYKLALEKGISKESAAFLLPMSAMTDIYMNGTLRSWIHYIELRAGNETQSEHREIALAAKNIFVELYPNISAALSWTKTASDQGG